MHSMDKVADNLEKLAAIFPNCITETMDECGGGVKRTVDFDMLRQELSNNVVEGLQERYQFTWPDKKKAMLAANAPINKTLRPCREESVDFDNTENLYIEGDNLEVLKLLQETYLGEVKMIYIDPPYNTGNDFVYNDSFVKEKTEFEHLSGFYDDNRNQIIDKMQRNTESNGRFHTDWLNMMYPRLKVAKDLLSKEGIIFISIDANELYNLKKVCDELFGAVNFIEQINIVTGANQSGDGVLIQKNVEYLLCYARNIGECCINRVDKTDESYRNLNDAPTPLETRLDMGYTIYYNPETGDIKPLMDYDKSLVKTNDSKIVYKDDSSLINNGYVPVRPGYRNGKLHRWRWGFENFKTRINNIVMFENKGKYVPRFLQNGYNAPKNIQNFSGGAIDIKNIFGEKELFSYPKSVSFVRYLIEIGANKDSLILDFFSGSATTAHAVMQLNAEDGGHRKFIMVQLPEACDEKSEAFKAGYKNIYQDKDFEEISDRYANKFGYKTKQNNKNVMVSLFKLAFRNNYRFINDYETLCEMEAFQVTKSEKGKKEQSAASSDAHDDLVTAMCGVFLIRDEQDCIPSEKHMTKRKPWDPFSYMNDDKEQRKEVFQVWD